MLINQLSKESGVSVFTIRYYQKFGLIAGKANSSATNTYYQYSADDVEKLGLIQDAKSAGFTLAEIKDLLHVWFSKKLSIDKKIKILDTKLSDLDDKIAQIKTVKKIIGQFKKDIVAGKC
jgi:MerR family Zn(II)-responsive transcriptional regulator of zntA